ncbi:MAG: dihydrofolate reductase [Hyphomicrobiales bacterium]|nr:dihydrofolate reductase [Hyphomicrobiales bacterium]
MATRVRMPSISYIVARSYPGNVIGYKNRLPWHLKSDLKRFRQLTTGHAIIMGRATYDSIGRPLPNRTNIVISNRTNPANANDINVIDDTILYWANTKEDALFVANLVSILRKTGDVFIIGGQTVFSLYGDIVNRVYLTQVFADVPGDAFFDMDFPTSDWKCTYEEDWPKNYSDDDHPFRFSIYVRKKYKYRYELLSHFFTEQADKLKWLKNQVPGAQKIIEAYVQENLQL